VKIRFWGKGKKTPEKGSGPRKQRAKRRARGGEKGGGGHTKHYREAKGWGAKGCRKKNGMTPTGNGAGAWVKKNKKKRQKQGPKDKKKNGETAFRVTKQKETPKVQVVNRGKAPG